MWPFGRQGYDPIPEGNSWDCLRHHGLPWTRLRWLLSAFLAVSITVVVVVIPSLLRDEVEELALHPAHYVLVTEQTPADLVSYYDFYSGPDANGSAGFQDYVSQDVAASMGLYRQDERAVALRTEWANEALLNDPAKAFPALIGALAQQKPVSVRLEGTTLYNSGLFVLDVEHMPVGCGMWPAIWLTNEDLWPMDGEIDIIEGVNNQNEAKTALHTTANCTMADVTRTSMTGEWDTALGVPDPFTGEPSPVPVTAKNCYIYAKDQWLNQGCVAVDREGKNFGPSLNEQGGGLFILEWNPEGNSPRGSGPSGQSRMQGGFIRSWAFVPAHDAPATLREKIAKKEPLTPDLWPKPYGYFKLDGRTKKASEATGCSSAHFKDMHLVINIAVCGLVAGQRFQMDCPNEYAKHHQEGDSVIETCERYVREEPSSLLDAEWRIRSIRVYSKNNIRAHPR